MIDELRQAVETFYANKAKEIDENDNISDKCAIKRIDQYESWESSKLAIIDDFEELAKEFNISE